MGVTRFGKYELLKRVGYGGMGEVYLARQLGIEGFEKLTVLKRLHPRLSEADNADEFVNMFLDEARLAARLNHPNIVQIYDLGRVDKQYFIAMEYVNGVDLDRLLRRAYEVERPLPDTYVVKILSCVCDALTYAHSQVDDAGQPLGLVHRDVTPHNVLVSFDGTVKLTDFGIAKLTSRLGTTRAGMLKGKLEYMAPEQVLERSIDARVDLFSVGAMLYQATTGVLPFRRPTDVETLQAIVNAPMPPPAQHRPDYPDGLVQVLQRTLAKAPEKRYPDAISLQLDLDRFLMQQRDPCNAALIGRFVRDLFKDLVDAQARYAARQDQTVQQLLSGLAIASSVESSGETPPPTEIDLAKEQQIEQVETGNTGEEVTTPMGAVTPAAAAGGGAPGEQVDDLHDARTLLFVEAEALRPQEMIPTMELDGLGGHERRGRATVAIGLISLLLALVALGWTLLRSAPSAEEPGETVALAARDGGPEPHDSSPPASDAAVRDRVVTGDTAAAAGDAAAPVTLAQDAGLEDARRPRPRREPRAAPRERVSRGKRAVAGVGYLNIDSQPWAEVWLGRRQLGVTPLAYVKLPAGEHQLTVRNPELVLQRVVTVRITPGKTSALMVQLR